MVLNTQHVTIGQKLAKTVVLAIYLVLVWIGFRLSQITYMRLPLHSKTHQTSANRAICSEFDYFVAKFANLMCLDKFFFNISQLVNSSISQLVN